MKSAALFTDFAAGVWEITAQCITGFVFSNLLNLLFAIFVLLNTVSGTGVRLCPCGSEMAGMKAKIAKFTVRYYGEAEFNPHTYILFV
jgi:hypothetical protein